MCISGSREYEDIDARLDMGNPHLGAADPSINVSSTQLVAQRLSYCFGRNLADRRMRHSMQRRIVVWRCVLALTT